MRSRSRLLLFVPVVSVVALASCSGDDSGADDGFSLAVSESTSSLPTNAMQGDPTECRGFVNVEVGPIEPATLEAARAAHAEAEAAGEGEQWVQVAVAGDWQGVGQAWAAYAANFALQNSAGDNTYQIKRRATGLPDDATRIDSLQFFLVSDPIDELTLVCATADGDWPLGS